MKMSEEVTIGNDFIWYGVWAFAQHYLYEARKMKKLLNQCNNFCYIKKPFDLKTQDLFETINLREYLKCGTKIHKKSISKLQIIESIQ